MQQGSTRHSLPKVTQAQKDLNLDITTLFDDQKPIEASGQPPPQEEQREKAKTPLPGKGFRITGVGLGIAAAAFFAGRLSTKLSQPKPGAATANRTADGAEIRDILLTPEEAIQRAKAGDFKPEVYEQQNLAGNSFRYSFERKDPGAAPSEVALRGIENGETRVHFISQLRELKFNVKEKSFPLGGDQDKRQWIQTFTSLALYVAIFGLVTYSMRKALGGTDKVIQHIDTPEERFKNIGGLAHVCSELEELREKIKLVKQGADNVKLPRGILLSGAPGTGKTLIARALAGEADGPFVSVNVGEMGSMFVGVLPKRVANSFREARRGRDLETRKLRKQKGATGKEQGVCILYLDEFDSIGISRAGEDNFGMSGDSVSREYRNTVNVLLAEMDNVAKERNQNLIVVASTNQAELLDPALLRPGRFSRILEVPLPRTSEQRLDILQKLLANTKSLEGVTLEDPETLKSIAKITAGKTGDHLRAILEEAADLAHREDRTVLHDVDLYEAFQRQLLGRVEESNMPPAKKRLVAYHEHGHAAIALARGISALVVSTLPRGGTAGRVVLDMDATATPPLSLQDLSDALLVSAGGRAAEIEMLGRGAMTDGARADLETIRSVCFHILSNGMFRSAYALNLDGIEPKDLPPSHQEMIDSIVDKAVATARSVIAVIGNERMELLVRDSLRLGRELIGSDAAKFYIERIPSEIRTKIAAITEEFANWLCSEPTAQTQIPMTHTPDKITA